MLEVLLIDNGKIKISDLIECLEDANKKYGDIIVVVNDSEYGITEEIAVGVQDNQLVIW